VESREELLAYPQTSPEIYAWLPYHRDAAPDPKRPQDALDAPTIDSKPS